MEKIKTYYQQQRDSKHTIVFINGFFEEMEYWDVTSIGDNIKIMKRTTKLGSVFAFDLNEEHYKMDFIELVSLVDQLCEDHNVDKPLILVGHSIGGLISQIYACLFPKKVKGIILIDSSTYNDFFKKRIKRDLELCEDESDKEIYRHWLNTWLKDFDTLPDVKKIHKKIIVCAHLNIMSNYTQVIKNFYQDDYKAFYDDFRKRLKYYKYITLRNAHSKLILHMDASHFIQNTRTEQVFDSIREMSMF